MTRAIYILSYGCGYYKCYEEISEISDELAFDIFLLYFSGVGFLILSAYLNEIIPKEYGVSKNPFFCFNRLFKCKK